VAEGVRLYSQETWRVVMGDRGYAPDNALKTFPLEPPHPHRTR
jgi:hypothetical protein